MSSDDDQGRKRNTDRDHKPSDAARDGHAPRGAVGRPAAGMPAPGIGASARPDQRFEKSQGQADSQNRDAEERIVFRKDQEQAQEGVSDQQHQVGQETAQAQDPDKPYAIETGDPEVDQDVAEDHNMISREQAEEMMGEEKIAGTFFDEQDQGSDPSETSEAETAQESEQPDRPQFSQEDYAAAFERASQKTQSMQQDRNKDQGYEP